MANVKMSGKEKVSDVTAKLSLISISQPPTLPSLPPRNRFEHVSRRDGLHDSWSSSEEEEVDEDQEDLRRHLERMQQRIRAMVKKQRWKPFDGA